jgi:transcriptional regulator with XRE-family HTH domain
MISQLERGGCRYSQASLEAIARALGVTPAQLLSRDPSKAWDFSGNAVYDELRKKLVPDLWEKLDEMLINQVDGVIKSAERVLLVEIKVPEGKKVEVKIKKR